MLFAWIYDHLDPGDDRRYEMKVGVTLETILLELDSNNYHKVNDETE